jgi:hypothetical protein
VANSSWSCHGQPFWLYVKAFLYGIQTQKDVMLSPLISMSCSRQSLFKQWFWCYEGFFGEFLRDKSFYSICF